MSNTSVSIRTSPFRPSGGDLAPMAPDGPSRTCAAAPLPRLARALSGSVSSAESKHFMAPAASSMESSASPLRVSASASDGSSRMATSMYRTAPAKSFSSSSISPWLK